MSESKSPIQVCESASIQEGGTAQRFNVLYNGEAVSAFVIRVDDSAHGFLNRCSHIPVEMDWNYGEFLDDSGRVIVCATHGASYDGVTGECLGGPCSGNPLVRLNITEEQGKVLWTPAGEVTVPPEGIED